MFHSQNSLCCVILLAFVNFALAFDANADIYRWDTGEVIQGTSGADPLPFDDLSDFQLSFANLDEQDLYGVNFQRADLTAASFKRAILTEADFTDAIIRRATFVRTDFTKNQLYSTASYKAKELEGINLSYRDLSGSNFAGCNLAFAVFTETVWHGEPFFTGSNLADTDLSGASLVNAMLIESNLTNVNLTGANLKNARLETNLIAASFNTATLYNQWTGFPEGFNPVASGLTLSLSPVGDFDANDALDVADIAELADRIRPGFFRPRQWWLPNAMFDINHDLSIDGEDHRIWVTALKHTWFGDANLDGQFDSTDLVSVFQAGLYEDDMIGNSTWSTGDWNADSDFTSTDLITAFADGGYEQGPRAVVSAVPEPASFVILMVGLIGIATRRRYVGT